MIFDSLRMQELLKAYENEPDFMVPEIVFLARTDKLETERTYLEELFGKAPEIKHKDWLGRLLSVNHEQFRSVWFEIMLYGWLMKIGSTEVEPIIEGNYPDYSVELKDQRVIVEARAILETMAERDQDRFEAGIFWALKQIEKPYIVEILGSRSSRLPDWIDFQQRVSIWLDTNPNDVFEYNDGLTVIVLKTLQTQSKNNKTVSAFTNPGMARRITSEPIKRPLQEKAHQHSKLRKASHPYLIALYLESWYLSAEEVAKGWLGEEVWTVDFGKTEVVETYSDQTGIHFAGSEIRHTTVSGTLVFKRIWIESERCSYLQAWYVENPFAKVPLDSTLFPVEARYVVTDKSAKRFSMAWVKSCSLKVLTLSARGA
jgi:hypothetical protein